MPAAVFSLTSTAVAKRLSDVELGPTTPLSTVDAATDVPYRQVIINASAAVTLGSTAANATGGFPLATNVPLTLGPFSTGPIKLSELWVVGAATVTILGIPY